MCNLFVLCVIPVLTITNKITTNISRGADRGPRAPPLWLNPMHILLYPRIWTAEKIMLTEKNLGYTVHTSRLFMETHIQHDSKIFGGRAN